MAEGASPDNQRQADSRPESQPDLQELARDWITLWQSELAAMAADRETHEGWQAMMSLWAGAAAGMMNAMPRAKPRPSGGADRARHDRPDVPATGRAAAAAAPGAAAAAAAPDARDAEIERLGRLVGELERRLADLERKGG